MAARTNHHGSRPETAPLDRPPLLARFGVTALATGLAGLASAGLMRLVSNRFPFVAFFPAVIVSSWYGGFWQGFAATIAGALVVATVWFEPLWELDVQDIADAIGLLLFIGTGLVIAAIHESLHQQRVRLHAARIEAERAASEAQAARAEADAANQAKDEFLSVLSHELRTPLTAILGWASMLLGREMDARAHRRAEEAIERNARALAQLIEDILDISRIVTGKLRLDLERADLGAVVRGALEAVRPSAETKGITLVAAIDGDVGMMSADPVRLQQVVWNLLSNAIKFTPSGGRVDLRVERTEREIRLRVADTGQGISADFLPHVFERFRQADAGPARRHGGLGLGLAIVRHLIELHGGTVVAESAGSGKGSTFTVTFPLAACLTPGADAVRQSAGPARLDGTRVLVVDDDEEARMVLASILEHRGAQVSVAASSDEAIRTLANEPIDVLVSDIGMPGEDGYAMMRRATAMLAEQRRHIPAMAVTAYAGSRDAEKAHEAGFEMHVPKPISAEHLVRAVARLAMTARSP